MKKLIAGIIVAGIFIYLTLRGVDFGQVGASLADVSFPYLFLALFQFILISICRSLRWGVILRFLVHIPQLRLFPLFSVGLMAVVVLPARLGELVRPYALRSKVDVPYMPVLGTILVERLLDITVILAILGAVVLEPQSPPWLVRSGYGALVALGLLLGGITILHYQTDRVLRLVHWVASRISVRLGDLMVRAIRNLEGGLHIISSPWSLLLALAMSALVWGLSASAIYTLFRFQGLELPAIAAFTVLVITVAGISLPTAPGMIGNFHYASVLALSLYSVPKEAAFAFSMVYYLSGIGLIILLGLFSLPYVNIRFGNLMGELATWTGKRN